MDIFEKALLDDSIKQIYIRIDKLENDLSMLNTCFTAYCMKDERPEIAEAFKSAVKTVTGDL